MPDQYHDVDGNPIVVNAKPTYHDYNGSPVQATQPYKDPITAATEKASPWLGRAATEALPAIGSFAGAGGTLVGTGISQMMKRARPDLFGEQPQGADSLVNAGKELLLNNALPAGLGKLGGLAQIGRASCRE